MRDCRDGTVGVQTHIEDELQYGETDQELGPESRGDDGESGDRDGDVVLVGEAQV